MTAPHHQPHSCTVEQLFEVLESSPAGLSTAGGLSRLVRFCTNRLPETGQPSPLAIFLHQFRSPLIYILLVAAMASLLLGDWTDAGFISVVLFINAAVGGFQVQHSPVRNRLLLIGTVVAQLIHIGAMYTPGLRDVLHVQPVSLAMWLALLALSIWLLVGSEIHKWYRARVPLA